MFKLQIVSDIHLETRHCIPHLEKHAPHIALLGDIGNLVDNRDLGKYRALLQDLKSRFDRVFLIAGNHEFYGKSSTMEECFQRLRSLCDELGIIFLEKGEYLVPETDIVILGTTLWTAGSLKIKPSMNDYHQIKLEKKKLLKIEDTLGFHQENVTWLKSKIDEHQDHRIIILTHHAPVLDPLFNSRATYYGTDLSALMAVNVKIWGFGHTHQNADFRCRETQVVTNAYGYNHEVLQYKPDFYVQL